MRDHGEQGRIAHAKQNILFGYIGQAATAVMSFILRRIFILHLSETLLGINSTYTNILSILSMAELGIGTALNFALYAPVAQGDTEKVKAYMQMYRRAYRTIAIVVAVVGLMFAPFLKYLIKEPEGVTLTQLTVYYLIFLFNTVSTYLVAYKYSLVNAEQKNYIQTNIITVTKIITVLCQIAVLVLTESFLVFLLTDAIIQLVQKIFVSRYLDARYPLLSQPVTAPLSGEERSAVWKKTRALLWHRIGDVLRLQTDALIISSMIQVAVAGFIDNYVLVITTVSNFVGIIFNSVISGFGNLIATESRERQKELFQVYRFCAAWIYGFSATGFVVLLSPLIRLWLGDGWVLPQTVVLLILADYYFKGDRIVNSNFKTAAGVFEQDKYLAMLQGIVNLVLSILLVQKIGLAGIYIGTVVSGLIANVTKPFIIYRTCFDEGPGSYFADSAKYFATVCIAVLLCGGACSLIIREVTVPRFAVSMLVVTVIFNALFAALFYRRKEFSYLMGIAAKSVLRR